MENPQTVTVNILDKDYQVACEPGEVEILRESARYLDEKMRTIKSGSAVIGLDRLAVMTALNIAHDFLAQTRKTDEVVHTQESNILTLSSKLDDALNRLKSVSSQAY